ncbi:MAG: sulfur carrier protein [Actinomycetota bacterium]|nr:sulfur carrier protein [Actinomycetota bacterium]
MQILLRNPKRTVEVTGPLRVAALLKTLEIDRETVLVIRNDTLVPGDAELADTDAIEIRPVISGGSGRGVPEDSGAGVMP